MVEKYARVSVTNKDGIEFIAGLEFREGDIWRRLRMELRSLTIYAVGLSEGVMDPKGMWIDPADYNLHAEVYHEIIKEKWPSRSYFIEVGKEEEWIQIFAPFGLPRVKSDAA